MITTKAVVTVDKKISENLISLQLDIEKYKEWAPGMFLQLSLLEKSASEPWLDSRAFSFASWGSKLIRVLVRIEGSFTSKLASLAEMGLKTSIRYPFGDFLLNSNNDKVFLAGGAGISVFLSYLDFLNKTKESSGDLLIIHSSKQQCEQINNIYGSRIPSNVSVIQAITNPKSVGYTGRFDIGKLRKTISNMKNREFYICGPQEFSQYWVKELSGMGLSFKVERWIQAIQEVGK